MRVWGAGCGGVQGEIADLGGGGVDEGGGDVEGAGCVFDVGAGVEEAGGAVVDAHFGSAAFVEDGVE